ncbi:MAG: hypothetical protein KAJ19_10330, partial [Gammaproteobacteria bacterium]|nr:hypothetical protein [Gammaproteobacteria bacterium]
MADTKYIAVKNFYGPNGMEHKGKEAVYNAKHVKKGLIVTEDEWKKMQGEAKKANRIAANARTTALSQVASKEVKEVAGILTSQIEVIAELTENVEVAFTELGNQVEAQAKELVEQKEVNAELIKTIGKSVKLIDGLVDDVNRLKAASVTPEVKPSVTPEVKP